LTGTERSREKKTGCKKEKDGMKKGAEKNLEYWYVEDFRALCFLSADCSSSLKKNK